MEDDEKTREQLVRQISESRLQKAARETFITGGRSTESACDETRHDSESIKGGPGLFQKIAEVDPLTHS
jgi:hypothetical protein